MVLKILHIHFAANKQKDTEDEKLLCCLIRFSPNRKVLLDDTDIYSAGPIFSEAREEAAAASTSFLVVHCPPTVSTACPVVRGHVMFSANNV